MKIDTIVQKSAVGIKPGQIKQSLNQGFSFKQALEKMEASWMSVQNRSDRLITSMPVGVRPLVETQLAINELSLKAQMITRAGEAVASTMRRIQQFGA